MTAHTILDLRNTAVLKNTSADDQRMIWVPFHFLPGARGSELSEKLVCGMDSQVARELVAFALGRVTEPYGLELLGTVAHTYADTFSHHGFSGVSSRRNRVRPSSIEIQTPNADDASFLGAKLSVFKKRDEGGLLPNFRNVFGTVLNAGAVGHGSVETCPDQPFLVWSFEYLGCEGYPAASSGDRNNPLDFIKASRSLHEMFVSARRAAEGSLGDPAGQRPFAEIEGAVTELVWTVAKTADRASAWKKMAAAGRLFNGDLSIPDYDPGVMDRSRQKLCSLQGVRDVRSERAYRFYQAAAVHRSFALRELLPRHGIVVV